MTRLYLNFAFTFLLDDNHYRRRFHSNLLSDDHKIGHGLHNPIFIVDDITITIHPATQSLLHSPPTITMPATRSRVTPARSRSVPLLSRHSLPPLARAIRQTPLYQSSAPIVLPLPIIRTALVYSEDGELPLVLLQRPLPRTVLHRTQPQPVQPRRVSINPIDVRVDGRRGTSPLTDISDESDVASMSNETILAKPRGEAGRPESGGYNLEAAMNWNSIEFAQLKVTPFRGILYLLILL